MFKQLKYLEKKDWLYIFISIGFIVLQVWLDLKIPEYMSTITTIIESPGAKINDVLINGAYMLLCAVSSAGAAVVVGYFASIISSNQAKNLRSQVFNKVINFSAAEINHFSTASLITRSTNDIQQVRMVFALGLQLLIKAPIMAIWALCKIVNNGVEWSIATGVAIGFLFIVIIVIVSLALPKFKKIQTMTDNVNRVTREGLTGVRVVRAFNAEDYQQKKFKKVNDEITNTYLYINKFMNLINPSMILVMNGLPLAIYSIGAFMISKAGLFERLSIFSNMVVFSSYAIQVVMSFVMLVMFFVILPKAEVSAKRINEILETKSSILDGEGIDKPIKEGEVQFVNVGFCYPDAEEYVLHDISFKVEKGQTVAFIGSTGSGKSTLINLVPRIYDATEGQVIVDGVNVKDFSREQLMNKIGYISQKAMLFSGTVESNVSFGTKNGQKPTNEDIENALEISQSNFVKDLPNGINSDIEQGGKNVSGGQKQRLSIARALARNPEIIIFDDSFSALDYKTDKLLREALKEKSADTTCLVVAQRIGTIKNADKIIVLDDGKIIGEGKHDDLMKNCKVYREIALSQLSKEELKNA